MTVWKRKENFTQKKFFFIKILPLNSWNTQKRAKTLNFSVERWKGAQKWAQIGQGEDFCILTRAGEGFVRPPTPGKGLKLGNQPRALTQEQNTIIINHICMAFWFANLWFWFRFFFIFKFWFRFCLKWIEERRTIFFWILKKRGEQFSVFFLELITRIAQMSQKWFSGNSFVINQPKSVNMIYQQFCGLGLQVFSKWKLQFVRILTLEPIKILENRFSAIKGIFV